MDSNSGKRPPRSSKKGAQPKKDRHIQIEKRDRRVRLPADCCEKIFKLTPKLKLKTEGETIEWMLNRVEEAGIIAAAVAARKQQVDQTDAAALPVPAPPPQIPHESPPSPPPCAAAGDNQIGFDFGEVDPTMWVQSQPPPPQAPPQFEGFVAEQNPSFSSGGLGEFSDINHILLQDSYLAWLLSPTQSTAATPQEVDVFADDEIFNLDDYSVGGCGGAGAGAGCGGFSQLMDYDHPIFQNPYAPPTGDQEEEEGGPSRG